MGCPPLQILDDIFTLETGSKADNLNTVANTFMELEKLPLSKSKCHKLHLGNKVRQCSDMQIHGEAVHNSRTEKNIWEILFATLGATSQILLGDCQRDGDESVTSLQ